MVDYQRQHLYSLVSLTLQRKKILTFDLNFSANSQPYAKILKYAMQSAKTNGGGLKSHYTVPLSLDSVACYWLYKLTTPVLLSTSILCTLSNPAGYEPKARIFVQGPQLGHLYYFHNIMKLTFYCALNLKDNKFLPTGG